MFPATSSHPPESTTHVTSAATDDHQAVLHRWLDQHPLGDEINEFLLPNRPTVGAASRITGPGDVMRVRREQL